MKSQIINGSRVICIWTSRSNRLLVRIIKLLFLRILWFHIVTLVIFINRTRSDQVLLISIELVLIEILLKFQRPRQNLKHVSLTNTWMDTSKSKKSRLSNKEFSKSTQSRKLELLITKARLTLTSEMLIVAWESLTNQSSWLPLKVELGKRLKLLKLLNRSRLKINQLETIS